MVTYMLIGVAHGDVHTRWSSKSYIPMLHLVCLTFLCDTPYVHYRIPSSAPRSRVDISGSFGAKPSLLGFIVCRSVTWDK